MKYVGMVGRISEGDQPSLPIDEPQDLRNFIFGIITGSAEGYLMTKHGFWRVTEWRKLRRCLTFSAQAENSTNFVVFHLKQGRRNSWHGEWEDGVRNRGRVWIRLYKEDEETFRMQATHQLITSDQFRKRFA